MTWRLVVGLGSHHGDDQAGWLIVEDLQDLGYPVDQLWQARHPADILDRVDSGQGMIVCDAAEGEAAAGSIQRGRWPVDELPKLRSRGTHDMKLTDVLELARDLGRCPATVDIWVVAGRNWIPGTSVNDIVRGAARRAAEAIWNECVHA